jgi:dimethylhistidine N-methyltransferase
MRTRTPRFTETRPPAAVDGLGAIRSGLLAPSARIEPKYFYDPLGSHLFAAITELPEYYLTRVEAAIIARSLPEIAGAVSASECTVIDLGAGDCRKAARLLPALNPAQYVAVDISTAFLREALHDLQHRFPDLDILGVGTDFSQRLVLPDAVRKWRRLFLYPGSSIGNFAPDEALAFLRQVKSAGGADGALLIGVDLAKDAATLEAAYDDALGVTAAFNRNVLLHLNRVAGTDFAIADWRHVARYDAALGRIEMHLEARRALHVRWPGGERGFAPGERIHTESSYKYTIEAFAALLGRAGFSRRRVWTDSGDAFAVFLART